MVDYNKKIIDKYKGKDVIEYSLINNKGTKIAVLNFAGILSEFSVIDNKKRVQLLLKPEKFEDFVNNSTYLNHVIARTGGRIKNATFKLNGKQIKLAANENGNTLHGGPNSFAKNFFDVKVDKNNSQIILTKKLSEKDDSYPGSLTLKVVYTLTKNNEIKISFKGTQEGEDGVFNPTLHSYFNLANDNKTDITGHNLWVNSDKHLEVDNEKNPTGKFINNSGPFNLKEHSNLNNVLHELEKSTKEKGFDDTFIVNHKDQNPIAVLKDNNSGRQISVYSKRNALVVYSSDGMEKNIKFNHGLSHPWIAMALEAQTAPNSENVPNLGNVTIKKGETKTYTIEYKYNKS